MTTLDELRARRGDPDDPFDQAAARSDYKRAAGRKDRELSDAARAGESAGRTQERQRARTAGKRRRSTRRVAAPARRAVRSVGGGTAYQLVRLFVITLGLVVLYLVLTNAGTLTGLLGMAQSAVNWIVSPTATIGGKA